MKTHKYPIRSSISAQAMGSLLSRSGVVLSTAQLEQLWEYHSFIRLRNRNSELTRIINFESMVLKHYVDSMIVGDLYPLPSPLMDIGSGAGFPGICLKIRYPKLRLILAEPKPNLVEFLNEVVALLDLKGIEVFEHRVTSQSFQTPVAGAITRAVEPMNKTILRTLGCLGCGGKLIFMKGPSVQSEIDSLKREFSTTHRILYDKRYSLPRTPYQRRLVVVERIQE